MKLFVDLIVAGLVALDDTWRATSRSSASRDPDAVLVITASAEISRQRGRA